MHRTSWIWLLGCAAFLSAILVMGCAGDKGKAATYPDDLIGSWKSFGLSPTYVAVGEKDGKTVVTFGAESEQGFTPDVNQSDDRAWMGTLDDGTKAKFEVDAFTVIITRYNSSGAVTSTTTYAKD